MGKSYILPNNVILMPSYHPSPRNVNTKLISQKMMVNLFRKAKNYLQFNTVAKIGLKIIKIYLEL